MKTNIERVSYFGTPKPKGKWWRWHETCDICGADCGNDGVQTTIPPDTKEKDYCLNCLKKLLDNVANEDKL